MNESPSDLDHELTLDANATAGLLQEIFGAEMTAAPTECAHCGNEAEVGTLLAFTRGPGYVLRCSACQNIVLRIVETPEAIYLDARGAVYLRLARPGGRLPENHFLAG
jgi:Family of unknown function (DUF6510)